MKKISYGQLLTDYGMGTSVDDMFYRASDVDALLADVRAMVEAGKALESTTKFTENWILKDRVEAIIDRSKKLFKALAAVERHFLNKTSQP